MFKNLKRRAAVVTMLMLAGNAWALQSGEEIAIWGDLTPPGGINAALQEQVAGAPGAARVSGISRPTVTAWVPAKPNGAAMLVIPGGSYERLSIDVEGRDVARWLNSLGVTAFVLKHRLPNEGYEGGRHVPREDGLRAMKLIRKSAASWGLDPKRVGVMGFSAGGHLAAVLGTHAQKITREYLDAIDQENGQPDLMVLVYAATQRFEIPVAGSSESRLALVTDVPEELVSGKTSPAFIVASSDDHLVDPVRNSVQFYIALRKARVNAEIYISRWGGHGYGIGEERHSAGAWPGLCARWMKSSGFLADK